MRGAYLKVEFMGGSLCGTSKKLDSVWANFGDAGKEGFVTFE